MWVHLLNRDDHAFNMDDVEASVHKMYRRSSYTGGAFNMKYSFTMPLAAVTSQVKRMQVWYKLLCDITP